MEKMEPKRPEDLGRESDLSPRIPELGELGIKETTEAIEAVRRIAVVIARSIRDGKSLFETVYEIGRQWQTLREALEGGELIPAELSDLQMEERYRLIRLVLYLALDVYAVFSDRYDPNELRLLVDRLVEAARQAERTFS